MKKPHDKKGPRNADRPAAAPTHWGGVAAWYDGLVGDEGSDYQRAVVLPGVVRMLELKTTRADGMTVLDIACGQGVLCRRLAKLGCAVTGLDAAEPLIDAARRRNETDHLPIRYLTADATALLDEAGTPRIPVAAESLDAVTLVLAIQNITPLSPVWNACRTLLKPGGRLIVVMMHPVFRVPRQTEWTWHRVPGKPRESKQGRVVWQYLTSTRVGIQTHPGLAAHGKDASETPHFHRPLQAYVNTLGNAGLRIDHLEEWTSHKTSEAGPDKAALDRARNEIPMFLALRARKSSL